MSEKPALILKSAAVVVAIVCLSAALPSHVGRAAQVAAKRPAATRPAATRPVESGIDFNRDIRPILSDKCFVCHGPGVPNRQSILRLDSAEGVMADLGGGRRAIVAGHPEQSELVRRITSDNEGMRMPPADSGRILTRREIETLEEWISQGAQWQKHWAFIPPQRPAPPSVKKRD
ncbi:MAG: c-type cytochrome domain-containing protein, partial [Acidobacteriota bacterium]